ncbi:hypothetical protein R1flu_014948 [Riccia fluitans]|uniref:Uncharacterized protein n=1 Tax=Riccia fluitans TaxID=41844 RepID=A0ABD1YLB1_9MARC
MMSWTNVFKESRKALFVRHATALFGAVAVETAAFYPIDTLKTLLQVNANGGRKLDVSAVVEGVSKSAGFTGLYGGLCWHKPPYSPVRQLLGRLPTLGARFGVYELMTAFNADGRDDNYVTLSESFLAGLTAGAVESLVSMPFNFLKFLDDLASEARAYMMNPPPTSWDAPRTQATVLPEVTRILPILREPTRIYICPMLSFMSMSISTSTDKEKWLL